VKERKHEIEIFEIAIHKVEHETDFWKLKLHRWRLKYRGKPLEIG
jgi:hypothetical protein